MKKYGVENPSQSEEFKNKKKETSIKNYGVEYPNQNIEVMERTQINSKKYKKYTFPSGVVKNVQGYEPFALDELLILYNEEEVKTDRKDVPRIEYIVGGKKKYYFPDIWIPHENKLIEVKSLWTYTCKISNVNQKAQACREQGYNYETWIYDGKGNKTLA